MSRKSELASISLMEGMGLMKICDWLTWRSELNKKCVFSVYIGKTFDNCCRTIS